MEYLLIQMTFFIVMKKNKFFQQLGIDDSWPIEQWFLEEGTRILFYLKTLAKSNINVYPERRNIFKAFSMPLQDIDVVILGQDPYHRKELATGLAFAVKDKEHDTPTLEIIRDELLNYTHRIDVDDEEVFDYTLENWHNQGILLLNSALTVQEFSPKSHIELWASFIELIIKIIDEKENIIFSLWGSSAQKFSHLINEEKNILLKHSHPARDKHSNNKFFTGSKVFEKIDESLVKINKSKKQWLKNPAL